MFRHQGQNRNLKHNLKIASLLSFVAGLVNVAGFLAVRRLTTNVTGHFAFFTDEIFKMHFDKALVYFLYIFFFFLGSFVSSLLVEFLMRKNEKHAYSTPAALESVILLSIGMLDVGFVFENQEFIACFLLFAMGLQNALVTGISGAVVRTTHLTGLFTDLGIELSQLFFYRQPALRRKLLRSVKLHIAIIGFFFAGGIAGGVFYSHIGLGAMLAGAAVLVSGLLYDHLRLSLLILKRKFRRIGSEDPKQ
ncbi:YoaK family protein [Flavobacterium phragmitis]|uniref:Uncharacterized membrane protein YoaK, UPF0700 family n=1 Tax=Flavobacterium phragmitis TaxID=739143 RepID=A0A1I1XMB0_9FLAO|nr:YoaK family protein [Flavobacterium phragmitis]SFE08467.1 Uncharacterized membrane protein YoaK, UPF0700 family [Flavobacterium phragmitis]